jgi:hypothetical protein
MGESEYFRLNKGSLAKKEPCVKGAETEKKPPSAGTPDAVLAAIALTGSDIGKGAGFAGLVARLTLFLAHFREGPENEDEDGVEDRYSQDKPEASDPLLFGTENVREGKENGRDAVKDRNKRQVLGKRGNRRSFRFTSEGRESDNQPDDNEGSQYPRHNEIFIFPKNAQRCRRRDVS